MYLYIYIYMCVHMYVFPSTWPLREQLFKHIPTNPISLNPAPPIKWTVYLALKD